MKYKYSRKQIAKFISLFIEIKSIQDEKWLIRHLLATKQSKPTRNKGKTTDKDSGMLPKNKAKQSSVKNDVVVPPTITVRPQPEECKHDYLDGIICRSCGNYLIEKKSQPKELKEVEEVEIPVLMLQAKDNLMADFIACDIVPALNKLIEWSHQVNNHLKNLHKQEDEIKRIPAL